MSAKHTPGPWFATQDNGPSWTIRLDKRATVASISGASLHIGNTEANARLIAAAPDLLAFAAEYVAEIEEQAVASGDDVSCFSPLYNVARAAIAKAEGAL